MIVDIVFGFLGAGKTTFITRVLQEWGTQEKIVVLVNEFGEVGIDGELLTGQGGSVVEMPSGCICCTLQSDFRGQILEISRTLRPERVIIEPTGVATISQLRSIVEAQIFEDTIDEVHDILVTDVTGFMDLYKANRHFVESQVRNARLVLLNKCDRVDKRKALLIRDAITAIQPEVPVLMTEFGAVEWAEYRAALSAGPAAWKDSGDRGEEGYWEPSSEDTPDRPGGLDLDEGEEALGFEAVGYVFEDLAFDQERLQGFFQDLNRPDSGLGQVVRAKGIFRVGERWLLMELASGEVSSQPLGQSSKSKVSIIGRDLNRARITDALDHSVSGGSP